MPNNRNLKDALLLVSGALPASTTSTVTTAIDTLTNPNGDFVAGVEFVVTPPALTTAQLPDGKTMTYTVELDSAAAVTSPTTILTLGTQTGAGGAGATAPTPYRFRLPTTAPQTGRYIRVRSTPSASGTGDASSKSVTMQVVS